MSDRNRYRGKPSIPQNPGYLRQREGPITRMKYKMRDGGFGTFRPVARKGLESGDSAPAPRLPSPSSRLLGMPPRYISGCGGRPSWHVGSLWLHPLQAPCPFFPRVVALLKQEVGFGLGQKKALHVQLSLVTINHMLRTHRSKPLRGRMATKFSLCGRSWMGTCHGQAPQG